MAEEISEQVEMELEAKSFEESMKAFKDEEAALAAEEADGEKAGEGTVDEAAAAAAAATTSESPANTSETV